MVRVSSLSPDVRGRVTCERPWWSRWQLVYRWQVREGGRVTVEGYALDLPTAVDTARELAGRWAASRW